MAEKQKESKGRIILCPFRSVDDPEKRCNTEVNLSEVDECPKCGRDVQRLIDRDEYEDALSYWRESRTTETKKGKKRDRGAGWNPFS